MPSVAFSPSPVLQFFDNTGSPAVGGSLLTQVGGVNYPTYSDNAGVNALPNPIPLNSRGEVSTAAGATSELFLVTGVAYTFTLNDKNGNQLWSVSNIVANGSGQSVTLPAVTGTANAIVLTNSPPIVVKAGTIQWFIPTVANTAATTINVDNNGATSALWLTRALIGGEMQAGVPTQIISNGTSWILNTSAKGPLSGYYIDSGTVNALAITVNMAQGGNLAGGTFDVQVSNTTTTNAPTLNINAGGANAITLVDGTAPPSGCMVAGKIYTIKMMGISSPVLVTPSRVTSSFTVTLTGMTTTITGTINYAIAPDGRTVTISILADILGTSNATTMTGTGWPAALIPGTAKNVNTLTIRDSGGSGAIGGSLMLPNSGTTVTFSNAPPNITASLPRAWTNTGSKGLLAQVISYTLD